MQSFSSNIDNNEDKKAAANNIVAEINAIQQFEKTNELTFDSDIFYACIRDVRNVLEHITHFRANYPSEKGIPPTNTVRNDITHAPFTLEAIEPEILKDFIKNELMYLKNIFTHIAMYNPSNPAPEPEYKKDDYISDSKFGQIIKGWSIIEDKIKIMKNRAAYFNYAIKQLEKSKNLFELITQNQATSIQIKAACFYFENFLDILRTLEEYAPSPAFNARVPNYEEFIKPLVKSNKNTLSHGGSIIEIGLTTMTEGLQTVGKEEYRNSLRDAYLRSQGFTEFLDIKVKKEAIVAQIQQKAAQLAQQKLNVTMDQIGSAHDTKDEEDFSRELNLLSSKQEQEQLSLKSLQESYHAKWQEKWEIALSTLSSGYLHPSTQGDVLYRMIYYSGLTHVYPQKDYISEINGYLKILQDEINEDDKRFSKEDSLLGIWERQQYNQKQNQLHNFRNLLNRESVAQLVNKHKEEQDALSLLQMRQLNELHELQMEEKKLKSTPQNTRKFDLKFKHLYDKHELEYFHLHNQQKSSFSSLEQQTKLAEQHQIELDKLLASQEQALESLLESFDKRNEEESIFTLSSPSNSSSSSSSSSRPEQTQTLLDNKENNSENQNPLPSNQENDLQPMEMEEDLPLPTTNLTQHNAQAYDFSSQQPPPESPETTSPRGGSHDPKFFGNLPPSSPSIQTSLEPSSSKPPSPTNKRGADSSEPGG
jgi:hypothetical protein